MCRPELLLVLLFACNGPLGLEAVREDTDGDGRVDERDNCLTIANADQEDYDLDGIGDACDTCEKPSQSDADGDGIDDACDGCVGARIGVDSGRDGIDDGCELACPAATGDDIDDDGIDDACDRCVAGPDHNEDGDIYQDACDDCPSLANDDPPESKDLDRIADVCDPGFQPWDTSGKSPQSQRLFDPFSSDRPMDWVADPGWTIADDVARSDGSTMLARVVKPLVIERFLVETTFVIEQAQPISSVQISVTARCGMSSGCPLTSCKIDSAGHVVVAPFGGGAAVTSTGTVDRTKPIFLYFRSRTVVGPTSNLDLLCVASNDRISRLNEQVAVAQGPAQDPTFLYGVSLITRDAVVAFRYFWLLNG